jgi:hypothetical protein
MEQLLANEEALQFHADQIRVNGFTILHNALPLSYITEMRARFDILLDEHIRDYPQNRGSHRYQMYLPFEPPFSDPRLYAHPAVMNIVERVLGQNLLWSYLASDTPLPGSDYQQVHSDTQLLFPESPLSLPPYALVVNVPLVDVTEENGPLELWPGGTHYMPGRINIPKHAAEMSYLRLTMPEGGLLIRDLRAWHRGSPNRGTRSRPNVALVYTRPWYRFEQKPPTLLQSQYDALDDKTKSMLRYATILKI